MFYTFCIYETDLYSGLLHIFFDEKNNEKYFMLKPIVIIFNNHHENPKDVTIFPYSLSNILSTLPLILVGFVETYLLDLSFTSCIILSFLGFSSTITHAYSHYIKKDNFITKYITISKKDHMIHHKTYDENFCLLTGWGNPLLNYLYKKHFIYLKDGLDILY